MQKLKKKYLFLLIIILFGLVTGILFSNIISTEDKRIVYTRITSFFNDLKNNTSLDYWNNLLAILKNNYLYLSLIIIFSLSIIGLLFNNFILFLKSFILGFIVGSIINIYFYAGVILALFYLFPVQLFNLILYAILIYHANTLSLHIFDNIFRKKDYKFTNLLIKDLKISGIIILLFFLSGLFEIFLTPFILKLFSFLIP